MGKRQSYHVSPHKRGWQLKKEHRERPLKTFRTKDEAVDFGRNVAKKASDFD
jgi:hypothetical protein